jgi:hypothetical protein
MLRRSARRCRSSDHDIFRAVDYAKHNRFGGDRIANADHGCFYFVLCPHYDGCSASDDDRVFRTSASDDDRVFRTDAGHNLFRTSASYDFFRTGAGHDLCRADPGLFPRPLRTLASWVLSRSIKLG